MSVTACTFCFGPKDGDVEQREHVDARLLYPKDAAEPFTMALYRLAAMTFDGTEATYVFCGWKREGA